LKDLKPCKIQRFENIFVKSLSTVRRQSPDAPPGISIVALDGGASLCQREEIWLPPLVKGRCEKIDLVLFHVIPAKAGIQCFQGVTNWLDPGFHRGDG